MHIEIGLEQESPTDIKWTNFPESLVSLFKKSAISSNLRNRFFNTLATHPNVVTAIEERIEDTIDPLVFLFNDDTDTVLIFQTNAQDVPTEPGESGSILAYVRALGYGEEYLCSDCFGQLSCSSCAVEVLGGKLENPVPREEEFDMLDIDKRKPASHYTRLGCQSKIGKNSLVLQIRKSLPLSEIKETD